MNENAVYDHASVPNVNDPQLKVIFGPPPPERRLPGCLDVILSLAVVGLLIFVLTPKGFFGSFFTVLWKNLGDPLRCAVQLAVLGSEFPWVFCIGALGLMSLIPNIVKVVDEKKAMLLSVTIRSAALLLYLIGMIVLPVAFLTILIRG